MHFALVDVNFLTPELDEHVLIVVLPYILEREDEEKQIGDVTYEAEQIRRFAKLWDEKKIKMIMDYSVYECKGRRKDWITGLLIRLERVYAEKEQNKERTEVLEVLKKTLKGLYLYSKTKNHSKTSDVEVDVQTNWALFDTYVEYTESNKEEVYLTTRNLFSKPMLMDYARASPAFFIFCLKTVIEIGRDYLYAFQKTGECPADKANDFEGYLLIHSERAKYFEQEWYLKEEDEQYDSEDDIRKDLSEYRIV